MDAKSRNVEFAHISGEFAETFGYVRQDIKAIRNASLSLNYTTMLLICCACQMLAWHKDLKDHEVFTSLLPVGDPVTGLGKMIFDSLRNGLAHRFRPDTLKIGGEAWRFSISSRGETPVHVARGNPSWLLLSAAFLEERMIAQIDDYEQELRRDVHARINFVKKSAKCIRAIPTKADGPAAAWSSLNER
jgi:hypothetical protein